MGTLGLRRVNPLYFCSCRPAVAVWEFGAGSSSCQLLVVARKLQKGETMKLIKAWLAGAVTMMVLGSLFHAVLAGDYLMSQMEVPTKMPEPWLILCFVLPVTLIMAYMYPKGYGGRDPALEGFRFGALVGIIMVLPLNMILIRAFDASIGVAIVDVPWHVVEEGLVGMVIALVYGRSEKTVAT